MNIPFITKNKSDQSGFALPTIIVLTLVMSFVAYAALLQANNNLNLAYKQAYIQMARVASKAAVDYAQEQFDSSTCGEYDGSVEQDLVSNNRYRVTFKSEVLETSADGYEKTIQGTGSVYLPKTSAGAKYVFDIRSEIVRTYALCKSPDNFGPLVWLDASDTSTLKKTTSSTTSTVSTVGQGLLDLFLPNDTVEEKVTNGSQGILSWLSNDIEMHTCDRAEYTFLACNGSLANRDLYVGMVFQNVNVPKDAIITSATLQLHGATPSGTSGAVTHRTYGLYESTSNPHLSLFAPFGSSQVKSRITDPALHTTAFHDQSSNNFPPGNVVNFDITNVVQEMVNEPNWNPSGSGGRLGLGIERVAGSGSRRACKGNPWTGACENNGPTLVVTYTSGAPISQAENGEGVNEWHDKSGNNNHARSTYGNTPTRVDNQINGKTSVRFNNGAMLSTLTNTVSNKREMTVFAITKPSFDTSATDGRLISGMSTTGTNDTNGTTSVIPLMRNSSTYGFSSIYGDLVAGNRTDFLCGSVCNNTPYMMASIFRIASSNSVDSFLRGNGQDGAEKLGITPSTTTPPYTYSIDQLYFGGRREGAMPGSGTNYLNGDYAELVVYDKALTCREVEALEEYFRNKWNLYPQPAETSCPADTIPTL